jgi:hypothetical protein
VLALLFFNICVEIGQLIFIGIVFLLMIVLRQVARRVAIAGSDWAWTIPPYLIPRYLIGSVAAFWVLQRIVVFV